MATCIDITDKLSQEEKSVKLGDKVYPVDDSKNTMIKVMALMENTSDGAESMDAALRALLGEEAANELNALKINGKALTFESYKRVFIAVMATATDMTYEDALARFQQIK